MFDELSDFHYQLALATIKTKNVVRVVHLLSLYPLLDLNINLI